MAKAAKPGKGTLHAAGHHVDIADAAEATRLYQKGSIGEPQAGNTLRLSLVEAAWLATQGRLDVEGGAAGLLAEGARQGDRTEVLFLAYSDLRSRGLVVRHHGPGFKVWPRGQAPPHEPEYMVRVVAEGDSVDTGPLLKMADARELLAVVDEDGAVTHYKVEEERPAGTCRPTMLPKAEGVLLADRVLVTDPFAAQAYATQEFLGTPSPAGLVLSLVEASALQGRGVLAVANLEKKAKSMVRVGTYTALREAGVVVKSGFRFGTHLRGYAGDPGKGHALWLIHVMVPKESLHLSSLSRGIRLAHGVRKRFLVAIPGPGGKGGPRFIALSWFKP